MTALTARGVEGALARYRLLAFVVGIGLIVLVFVGLPLKYVADPSHPIVVQIVGTLHGYLYMVYLVTVFLLSRACDWSPVRTIGVMLAGTVPFLGLVVEHYVTRDVRAAPVATRG
jgi:integral membrane protein